MAKDLWDDKFFARLATTPEPQETPAPSRLKARIYSALILRQAEKGRLLNLESTKAAGRQLCVFEELVRIAPLGETAKSLNYCRVCHARILAERLDHPPIYWPGCPYVSFKKG